MAAFPSSSAASPDCYWTRVDQLGSNLHLDLATHETRKTLLVSALRGKVSTRADPLRCSSRSSPVIPRRTSSLVSLGLICLLIFLLVPWQVGFLGCWVYHLSTCASIQPTLAVPENAAIPLMPRDGEDEQSTVSPIAPSTRLPATTEDRSAQNEREHLLLLMTWLLPLAAPVLAVWVRTLFTAGLTTPFDGDHNVLYVAPFLVLVDPSWGLTWTWVWGGPAGLKSRWTMVVLAFAAFVWGPRYTYLVFEVASAVLAVGVVAHFIKR